MLAEELKFRGGCHRWCNRGERGGGVGRGGRGGRLLSTSSGHSLFVTHSLGSVSVQSRAVSSEQSLSQCWCAVVRARPCPSPVARHPSRVCSNPPLVWTEAAPDRTLSPQVSASNSASSPPPPPPPSLSHKRRDRFLGGWC
ncbi:unnamed protein product, partial [Iphiclides podalirius]